MTALVPNVTRLRARRPIVGLGVDAGDEATFVSGADYVPGWDAGQWVVKPDATRAVCHWTSTEMLEAWEVVR